MTIIPAIDIRGGSCVRLTQGDYARETVYDADPVAVAKRFREQGAEWVHVVDLDGAKEGRPNYVELASRIVREVGIKVEYGGGIRNASNARRVLSAGVSRVVAGSALARDPDLAQELFKSFGAQLVAGVDTKEGSVAVEGWTETTELSGLEFAKELVDRGCTRIIYTDIARDGTLEGPNLNALKEFVSSLKIPVVASGGVASLEDLRAIADAGAEAAIVGKSIYEGRVDLREAIRELNPS